MNHKNLLSEFIEVFTTVFGLIIGLGLALIGFAKNNFIYAFSGVILIMVGIAVSVIISNQK